MMFLGFHYRKTYLRSSDWVLARPRRNEYVHTYVSIHVDEFSIEDQVSIRCHFETILCLNLRNTLIYILVEKFDSSGRTYYLNAGFSRAEGPFWSGLKSIFMELRRILRINPLIDSLDIE